MLDHPPPHRPFFALALRLVSALALASLYMLVKLAGRKGVALPEILFWRQAGSLPLIAGWMAANGWLGELYTRRLWAHARRSIAGMTGMGCAFGASILLPLPLATILGFTTPLFAVILAALVLGESIGRWRWIAVILGFAGVLVIMPPSGVTAVMAAHTGSMSEWGLAAGLSAGFMVALISIQIRDLTRTEAAPAIVFYFSLFGTVIMAPILPFVFTRHSASTWAVLLAIGAVGTVGQILLTTALRYGAVASVVVMDYTQLVWTTLYGLVIFSQLPPATTWAGAPLIVAAGLTIAWREHRLQRSRSF